MRIVRPCLAVAALVVAATAFAHRVDEYLQAALVSVGSDRVQIDLRLTPGIAVAPGVLAGLDADGDGRISLAEQRAYVVRVLKELALRVNQVELTLEVTSAEFADVEALQEGIGEIRLQLSADLPPSTAPRTLRWENVHRRDISVYQVNTLVPKDGVVQLGPERRNPSQSAYELRYTIVPANRE